MCPSVVDRICYRSCPCSELVRSLLFFFLGLRGVIAGEKAATQDIHVCSHQEDWPAGWMAEERARTPH